MPGMQGINYTERLDNPVLFSPECRRLSGDLMKVYKIKIGYCPNLFPNVEILKTKCISLRFEGKRLKGMFFVYTERWVSRTNCLAMEGDTMVAFTRHMDIQGVEGYGLRVGRRD